MTLDAPTLLLISVLMTVIFFFSQLLIWWCNREIVAMAYWAISSLMVLTIYLIIVPLTSESPNVVWPILGNLSTTGSIAFMWAGVRVFVGKSPFNLPVLILLALHSTIAVVLATVIQPGFSFYGRIMFQSPMTCLLAGMTAWELLNLRKDLRDMVTRMVGALFVWQSFFFFVRFLVAGYIAFTDDSYPTTFMIAVTYLESSLFLLLMNIGFLVMTTTRLQAQLHRLATTDSLTGLKNRSGFTGDAEREFARSRLNGSPISVMLIDIDHFKKCNDTHGHIAGDIVLQAVAGTLKQGVRSTDLICRWGGEEFCGLLPDTGIQGARTLLERLRSQTQGLNITHEGHQIGITISVGIAQISPEDKTFDDLVARADRALYSAKSHGRNRVCLEPPEELPPVLNTCL